MYIHIRYFYIVLIPYIHQVILEGDFYGVVDGREGRVNVSLNSQVGTRKEGREREEFDGEERRKDDGQEGKVNVSLNSQVGWKEGREKSLIGEKEG